MLHGFKLGRKFLCLMKSKKACYHKKDNLVKHIAYKLCQLIVNSRTREVKIIKNI